MKTLDRTQTPETFAMLADSPVQFMELWERTFSKDDAVIAETRAAMEAAGVQARTVHVGFGPGYDISHQDENSRNAGIQLSALALDLAVKTGGEIIVVHPSAEPLEEHERGERTELARQSITILEDLAGKAGCRVAIELIPRTNLGRTVEEIFELIDHAEPDIVGVCLDVNHLRGQHESLPDIVRSFGPRLFALHCSDYDGTVERHWPPMQGVIDWGAFLSALEDIDFPGPVNYEAILPGDSPAERLAFLEANYRELMAC